MNNKERDLLITRKIIDYCEEIERTREFFGHSFEIFADNSIYRNAVAMCILQIGELTGALSDDIKAQYSDIPWRNIKGMRNIVAHKYGNISVSTVWEAVLEDIPYLKDYCQRIALELLKEATR